MNPEFMMLIWIGALPAFLLFYESYEYVKAHRKLLEEELRGMKAHHRKRLEGFYEDSEAAKAMPDKLLKIELPNLDS